MTEALAVAATVADEPDLIRVRIAIDSLGTAAVVANEHLRLQAANAAAAALTGYSTAELMRLSIPDITHISDETVIEPLWRAFQATGRQHGTYQVLTSDGTALSVDYAALRISPQLFISLWRPAR